MYDTVANLAMFLTYESAERLYGLPRHALLKLAREGRIHVYRPLGRKAYVNREELDNVFRASADGQRGTATD
jgi:excisionase family DNA binding protein